MKTTSSFRLPVLPMATAVLATTLLLLAAAPGCLHAQTILNGSFESPALPSGDYAAGSGDNWMTTGAAYVFTNGIGDGTTPYDTQYERLASGDTDAQTISGSLTLGSTYILSLAASAFNTADTQLTITISGGATASQSYFLPAHPDFNSDAFPFMTCSLPFTPTTGAAVTVTFSNSGSAQIVVDNVQIVPEPGTWALLGLGLTALGLALRGQIHRA